ncbi:hypothetical protein CR513_32683, partial [Mucuna pruriens]
NLEEENKGEESIEAKSFERPITRGRRHGEEEKEENPIPPMRVMVVLKKERKVVRRIRNSPRHREMERVRVATFKFRGYALVWWNQMQQDITSRRRPMINS